MGNEEHIRAATLPGTVGVSAAVGVSCPVPRAGVAPASPAPCAPRGSLVTALRRVQVGGLAGGTDMQRKTQQGSGKRVSFYRVSHVCRAQDMSQFD